MKKVFTFFVLILAITIFTTKAEATSEWQTVGSAVSTGRANITVDGKFGVQTRQAVIVFQKAHGLTPDGIVGSKTRVALGM